MDRERTNPGGSNRFDSTQDEITSPTDLLKRLAKLFRIGDLLEEAYTARDVDSVVKLAREYRAAAESYAKVAGWLVEGGGNTTLIDARRQSIALLGKLSEGELRALAAGSEPRDCMAPVGTVQTAQSALALPGDIDVPVDGVSPRLTLR